MKTTNLLANNHFEVKRLFPEKSKDLLLVYHLFFFKHEAVTNRHVSLNLDPFISSFQANVSVLPVTRANIANCHVIEGVTALDARIDVIVRIAMLTGVIRLRENALANLDGKVTFFFRMT